MKKVRLNEVEYKGYLRYRDLRETSYPEFERKLEKKNKQCVYYNDCNCCGLQHDFFTNIGCEFNLMMLADDPEAEIELEEKKKEIIFY